VKVVFDDQIINIIQSPTRISISGLDQISNIQLNSSDLIDTNSGKTINSTDIVISHVPHISNPQSEHPKSIIFSIEFPSNLRYGIYQGGLFVSNGTHNEIIPITLKATPPMTKTLIFIIDGIILSIASWKIVSLFGSYLDRKMYPNSPSYIENYITIVKRLDNQGAVNIATTTFMIGKNTIIDIGTIIFGIAVGLILIPTSATILNVTYLSDIEILTLVGAGLGIGSLKEIIRK
jgi:hypothetical protein